MSATATTTEYGVQHPDENERVEKISPESANGGYMSAQEYAQRRAEASHGFVVTRTKTVTYSEWTAVDPAQAAAARERSVGAAVSNLRATLLANGYSEVQANKAVANLRRDL